MPRQPYPSYNVHDYADITTSYGDQEVILQIVRATHAAGHHVILDILLHGVVDGESIAQAVDAIRSGPFADRLSEETLDSFALDLSAADAYLIAWSRHLIDFEPYWVGGSPRHHPLTDEHPEWFCRDSAGQVTGVYTKAFDVAHPRWQEWFRQACLHLVDVLGVDGFRFDAPTYNYFHNWSLRTRANAGVSMLGALPLFDDLRLELKARNPQAMLYTEPSGVLLRQSMDVNYNYDEQWLLTAVMGGGDDPQWVADAADLGRWIEERDASLPEGAVTAHHIDSHDTFWWPLPGSKWRREQFGLPATTAWMTVFALSGGPYMMFVGGEHGMEDAVRAVNALRGSRPELVVGNSDRSSLRVDNRRVYAVLRHTTTAATAVLANLSDETVTTTCWLDAAGAGRATTPDALGSSDITWEHDGSAWYTSITLAPWAAVATSTDLLHIAKP